MFYLHFLRTTWIDQFHIEAEVMLFFRWVELFVTEFGVKGLVVFVSSLMLCTIVQFAVRARSTSDEFKTGGLLTVDWREGFHS